MTEDSYLSWYKHRMKRVVAPDVYSLVSSSVSEPWDLLKQIHSSPSDPAFEARYWTPNPYGLPDLISHISNRYGVPIRNVMICQGATSGIYLVARTFLKSGDRVLVESPGYEPLWQSPEICGAVVDRFPRPRGQLPADDEIMQLVTPETRLIMLTNLHNPTGNEISGDRIKTLVSAARSISPDIRVLVDEIYLDFNPSREQTAWNLDPAIITTSSLTKVYGLSILRCGWIFAGSNDLERLRRNQVLVSGIGSRYMETLSTFVFDHLDRFRDRSLEILETNRPIARETIEYLKDRGLLDGQLPVHGCVAFLKVPGVSNTRKLTDYLEDAVSLFCVPGDFFDAPDHIRLGIGDISPEKLKTAMDRLTDGLTTFRCPDR